MSKFPKMYLNREVAVICGCNEQAVKYFARAPKNGVHYVSEGRRKIYLWLESDIERFKKRPGPGQRPPKEEPEE